MTDTQLTTEDLSFIDELIKQPEASEQSFYTGEEPQQEEAQQEEVPQETIQEPEEEPLTEEEIEQLIEMAEQSTTKADKLENDLKALQEDITKKNELIEQSTKYWNQLMSDPKMEKLVKGFINGEDTVSKISESAFAALESEINSLPKEITNDVGGDSPTSFSVNDWIHSNKDSGVQFTQVK